MVRNTGLTNEYKPIEKIGENFYKIRWDIQPVVERLSTINEETGEHEFTGETRETPFSTWMSENVHYKPNVLWVRDTIINWYNAQIDAAILKGFVWKGMHIWLSTENQFNYKAAYDLAVQTQGATLPVKFKFGTTENPVYYTFETVEDLSDFYMSAMNFINTQLNEGWIKKDSIDWNQYIIEEDDNN